MIVLLFVTMVMMMLENVADDVGEYKNSGVDDVEQVDKVTTWLMLILSKFRIKAK